jgi:alpha-ketoglutarate-dependent taurine dioxygenase
MADPAPRMLESEIIAPSAWTAATISEGDWRVPIGEGSRIELLAALDRLRANPLPTILLDAGDFDLAETRKRAAVVRRKLDDGVGFAVVDKLPIEGLTPDETKALYWLLSNLVSRVVAGAWDGRMLHDVVDTEQKQGRRVRGDLTNQEIQWHTDNGFSCTPDYFGLLCIRPATEGGRNSLVSLHSAHNLMRQRHPRLLPRLYRPFFWNRMGEHHPNDSPVNRFPYFEYDGRQLKGRFNRRIVHAGYEIAGETLDDDGRDAVDAFLDALDDPSLPVSFTLEAGQAVYVNNRMIAHQRTPFSDAADPAKRRHLVRIYMRDHGPRSYLGAEGAARPPVA